MRAKQKRRLRPHGVLEPRKTARKDDDVVGVVADGNEHDVFSHQVYQDGGDQQHDNGLQSALQDENDGQPQVNNGQDNSFQNGNEVPRNNGSMPVTHEDFWETTPGNGRNTQPESRRGGPSQLPKPQVQIFVATMKALPAENKPRQLLVSENRDGTVSAAMVGRADKEPYYAVAAKLDSGGPCSVEFYFWSHSESYGEQVFAKEYEAAERLSDEDRKKLSDEDRKKLKFAASERNDFLLGNEGRAPPRVVLHLSATDRVVKKKVALRTASYVGWPATQFEPMLVEIRVLAVVRDHEGNEVSREILKTCPRYVWNRPGAKAQEKEGIFFVGKNGIPASSRFSLVNVTKKDCKKNPCGCLTRDGCGAFVVNSLGDVDNHWV